MNDYRTLACGIWEYNPLPAELAARFKASKVTYNEAGFALGMSGQNIYNWCKAALNGAEWGSTIIYLFMVKLAEEGQI